MQAGLLSLRRTPPVALTYAKWNSADKAAGITLSNGDLTAAGSVGVRSTISKAAGKHYWEILNELSTNDNKRVAIAKSTADLTIVFGFDGNANAYAWRSDGTYYNGPAGTAAAPSFTAGDRLMCALDLDNGKLWWGKNGTWNGSGDPAAGTGAIASSISGTYFAGWCAQASNGSAQCTANFGATALTYTPPTGFNAGLYS